MSDHFGTFSVKKLKELLKMFRSRKSRGVQPAMQWRIQAVWETDIPVWAPKKLFSSFLVFQQKYVEVAINDFKMHLIISKWQTDKQCRQKCRQKRKTMRQLEVKTKEETVYKSVFIYINM